MVAVTVDQEEDAKTKDATKTYSSSPDSIESSSEPMAAAGSKIPSTLGFPYTNSPPSVGPSPAGLVPGGSTASAAGSSNPASLAAIQAAAQGFEMYASLAAKTANSSSYYPWMKNYPGNARTF